ncbi:hypothetical protein H7F51_05120 [Novosphingobium flavum]|uniref:Uncharacterized protein n=1 Tax=Novosphingobium flavum TaxID=1778672 RepID=A0A7X1FQ38_9SPHN|nr:hypothetical protein [Novosphingobium flavum]MBC2664891.1 hypothetical protein [Novosphingobium flavum]
MRRALSLTTALLAAVLLAGCNIVVSDQPWFGAEDSVGRLGLREGLWAVMTDGDCRFDETLSAERWPECASAKIVRGDQLLSYEWVDAETAGGPRREFLQWQTDVILLADGDPMILQLRNVDATGERGEGGVVAPYYYVAVHPLERDDAGRIVRLERWLVECGPLPKAADDAKGEDTSHVTDRPFPGLTVNGNVCTAASVAALRRAALASQAMGQAAGIRPSPAHWVRDGWH